MDKILGEKEFCVLSVLDVRELPLPTHSRLSPLGYDAFSNLQRHAEELRWTPETGGEREERYALFSRSGFKPSVEEADDERDDLRLFTVEDVVSALKS